MGPEDYFDGCCEQAVLSIFNQGVLNKGGIAVLRIQEVFGLITSQRTRGKETKETKDRPGDWRLAAFRGSFCASASQPPRLTKAKDMSALVAWRKDQLEEDRGVSALCCVNWIELDGKGGQHERNPSRLAFFLLIQPDLDGQLGHGHPWRHSIDADPFVNSPQPW